MHNWINTFKLLGNRNRLRILKLLSQQGELPVKVISDKLDLTVKLASQHLVLLAHANFVQGIGKIGSVYYSFHPALPSAVKRIIEKDVKKI
ncbi:winged helix-turn-helix transcriptional regulator [Candidatus Uhrbacteria bacterium]|nr:winged helix-turn-helix transcriptional regulator [Candidatus Uhrbacteria bacterium]